MLQKFKKLKRIQQQEGILAVISFLANWLLFKVVKPSNYQKWQTSNALTKKEIKLARKQISQWDLQPKFSVIMPVYNIDVKWLKKAILSVRNQIYTNWELCIADDVSTNPKLRLILHRYSQIDPRIKVVYRANNGNISAASNSALALATGDYIALLDHDDEITPDALFQNAKKINDNPNLDFLYSDEDKIDTRGNFSGPFFKPDWSPDYFHACMYTCHFGVYRTSLIQAIGGFRKEYDGAQDYDLVLRVVGKTKQIHHIPRILYHWRIVPSSAASGSQAKPWALEAARKALQGMLDRSPYPGFVEPGPLPSFWRVRRYLQKQPLISIVIPSAGKFKDTPKGSLCLLQNCIESIQSLSTYRNFEIIVVDGYDIPETITKTLAQDNINLVRCSQPFNFSERINLGAKAAKGEIILLLNDDTEVITPDWLESMLEFAQQEEIGAVGAKLLFPDGKIQHTGVVIVGQNPGHPYYGFDGEEPGYFLSNQVNRNYWCVTGACLMIRQEVFQKLGGLDEQFPLNYNDVDFCLRVYQAGYRNVVTPYSQLIHYESVTRENVVRPEESKLLYQRWKECFNKLGYDPYYNPNLSLDGCFIPSSQPAWLNLQAIE